MRNLILYLKSKVHGNNLTADPPRPRSNRTKIAFVTTTANSISSINKAAHDPHISKQIEVSSYFVSQEVPESYIALNLSDQDVLMLVHLGYPIQDGIRETIEDAKLKGTRVISHKFEDFSGLGNVNTSDPQYMNITEYWDFGGGCTEA